MARGESLQPILSLAEILSRKALAAWAYVLSKSKKEKRAEVSVSTLKQFQEEVGNINGIKGDNEISSGPVNIFVMIIILD
jgi:hypothetical protein